MIMLSLELYYKLWYLIFNPFCFTTLKMIVAKQDCLVKINKAMNTFNFLALTVQGDIAGLIKIIVQRVGLKQKWYH